MLHLNKPEMLHLNKPEMLHLNKQEMLDLNKQEMPAPKIILETYRHTFSPEVLAELTKFARIHQHDDRISFKDAWIVYTKDPAVRPLFESESTRIRQNGYTGDVYDKMYKSARYYYAKKTTKDVQKPLRKSYETMEFAVLQEIDDHIRQQIRNAAQVDSKKREILCKLSPSDSFEKYCETYKNTTILREIQKGQTGLVTSERVYTVISKIKKTYKNRFYTMRITLCDATNDNAV